MQVFTLTVLSAVALNQRVSQEVMEELVSHMHHSSQNNPDLVLAEIDTKKEMIPYK